MMDKVNPTIFCKKLQEIDVTKLELKPHTNLKKCSFPPQQETRVEIDPRYLEDSRYISPEDKKRYQEEYEEIIKRQNEFYDYFTPENRIVKENQYQEEESDLESIEDDEDEENDEFVDDDFEYVGKNKM